MTPEEKIQYQEFIQNLSKEDRAYLKENQSIKYAYKKLDVPAWFVREYYDWQQTKRNWLVTGICTIIMGGVFAGFNYFDWKMQERDRLDREYYNNPVVESEVSPLESAVNTE